MLEEIEECVGEKSRRVLKKRLGLCWRKFRSVLKESLRVC